MVQRPCRRRLAVLMVSLALAGPWSTAAALPGFDFDRAGSAAVRADHLFARLRGWLAAFWAEEGCVIDPSGRCMPQTSATPQTDAPDVPPVGRDEGCGIDPGGKPCA